MIKKELREIFSFTKSSQFIGVLFLEIIGALVITIGMLWVFLKLAGQIINQQVIFFDWSIIHLFYAYRMPLLNVVMKSITFLGDEFFIGSAIIVTILFLLKKNRKEAVVFFFVLSIGIGLNLILKDLFFRPRPYLDPLVFERTYSFPSGHAMNSLLFYGSLVFFIHRNTRDKQLSFCLALFCGLLVVFIGISRIYLGAHYPSDVLAGYAAGMCWLITVFLVEKTITISRLFKKYESKRDDILKL